jgi:hypothetical protein
MLRVQCKAEWAGDYGEPNSPKTGWNGTGDLTVIVNRPNGTNPWILMTNTQGFWTSRQTFNLTVSILLLNGIVLKSQSNYSASGAIVILNADIDNLTSQVAN